MNKIISLYRDAVRDDWDKQTDATLANMQEAEQNLLSRLSAGEEVVKKVAKLKQALRSSMNELLKDTVSPELQDYFDYVSELRNKIAELEKEVERLKAEAVVRHARYAQTSEMLSKAEQQAAAGQRAVDAMEQNILSIVDACFHAFASSFRNDAKEMAEDLIKTIIQQSKEAL